MDLDKTPRTNAALKKPVTHRWTQSLADWRQHCLLKESKKLERELNHLREQILKGESHER